MYVEKRKQGKKIKYYLVHAYRDSEQKVKKIRKYLGANLKDEALQLLKTNARRHIQDQLKEIQTDLFNFALNPLQIDSINQYDKNIAIFHLNKIEWEQFTEDFVYNTNAIEGSTILRDEVHEILHKSKLQDSEEIETKGVAQAVEYIKNTNENFSISLIKKIHLVCFKGSKPFAGKIRDVEVVIRDKTGNIIHQGTPVTELKKEIKGLVTWYNQNKNKFKPLPLAAIIHNQFEDIHPFQDGNGRVGRILLNYILLKNKYPPINIFLEDRGDYYKTLQEYSKEGKIKPTLRFLIKQYNKMLKKVGTKRRS